MLDIYMKNEIITLYRRGMKIKEITRDLNISRNTVRRYVRDYEAKLTSIEKSTNKDEITRLQKELVGKPIRKRVSNKTVFKGELKQRFYDLIELDQEKDLRLGFNKQRLTASLLHRKLKAEGFDVGITTIQLAYKDYKNKYKEAFIKQHHEPGARAEYDFHEINVMEKGIRKKYYQATITLPHSNYIFVKHYENQKFENFADSLITFFEDIEGVPKTIVFDNMRNAVSRFLGRGMKVLNERLINISNYYGFKILTTNPRRGNEKGHVEKSGKIARDELFTFKYEFNSLKDIRDYVEKQMLVINKNKPTLINEKNHLLDFPLKRYELGMIIESKVDTQSLVVIDTNHYSVPDSYVGMDVNCNVYNSHINVYNKNNGLIASHIKKAGKAEYTTNILHYLPTFRKKPGALLNSVTLRQAPKVMQTLFHKYFTTNIKDFLQLIEKKDIYELSELLVKLNNGYSLKRTFKDQITIEDVSFNQLNQISNMYNQGEIN